MNLCTLVVSLSWRRVRINSLSIIHRCLTPVQHCESVPLKACAVRVCVCEQEDCMCVHSCLALIVLSWEEGVKRERGMEEGRADIGKVSACVCLCVWRRGIELQASLSEDSEKLSEQGAKGQGWKEVTATVTIPQHDSVKQQHKNECIGSGKELQSQYVTLGRKKSQFVWVSTVTC